MDFPSDSGESVRHRTMRPTGPQRPGPSVGSLVAGVTDAHRGVRQARQGRRVLVENGQFLAGYRRPGLVHDAPLAHAFSQVVDGEPLGVRSRA